MCLYLFKITLSFLLILLSVPCMFLSLLHILTRFAFNSIESFETEIAEDCSNNAKQRKEGSYSFKPPIKRLCSVVEKLTSQFVETAARLNIGGGGRVSVRCKRRLLLFGFVAAGLGSDTIRLDFGTARSIDYGRFFRLRGGNAHRPREHK